MKFLDAAEAKYLCQWFWDNQHEGTVDAEDQCNKLHGAWHLMVLNGLDDYQEETGSGGKCRDRTSWTSAKCVLNANNAKRVDDRTNKADPEQIPAKWNSLPVYAGVNQNQ